MSINDRILALEDDGKLVRFLPPHPRPPRRRLFLAESPVKEITSKDSALNLLGQRPSVLAALSLWTLGGRIWANGNRKPGFLKRLCPPPPEVWEIRVQEPIVKMRLLGRFAAQDTLILTRFYSRDSLKEKKSRAWEGAMNQCVETWEALFPDHKPFSGRVIHDYVSEECDDFSIHCK